jgi:hypothetical protein
MADVPPGRRLQFFPEFDDVLAHLIAELLRRRPEGFDPAVVVCGILFGDPTTGANEWAVAFSTAATIITPMSEILVSCAQAVEQLAAHEAAREKGGS